MTATQARATAADDPGRDAFLRVITYGAALRWAADDDGRLVTTRLRRIARARKYAPQWVRRCAGRQWWDVLSAARQFRADRAAGNARRHRW